MSDLPRAERLAKLRALEEWLDWQLHDTRRKIRDLETAATPPASYVIEPKQHPKHPAPALIHLAGCTMADRKTSPVEADAARIGLTKDPEHIAACEFCAPGKALGIDG
ncbi:hypothetical protein CLM62_12950 [Streptomyces sp. SA15]|uniref:DUF6233 domain-containing protein n=1 Tax=Streptomyces sp. SA15 TaxID=934019 RepID=UPI000BAF332E|nr:DUF6233 domain-containing protein [Streptomyces sp. SA15]PAZ15698.1 hypothetical protein CLM62_12950 [Streptomyces sp. SA15]